MYDEGIGLCEVLAAVGDDLCHRKVYGIWVEHGMSVLLCKSRDIAGMFSGRLFVRICLLAGGGMTRLMGNILKYNGA